MNNQPTNSRLDRLEAVVEKLANETHTFHVAVRGAITAQQEQIAELTENIKRHNQQIVQLTENVKRHDKVLVDLERQWQAYLNTIHPKQ